MGTDIKFCGLTRAEDAEFAVSLGAAYVGVIFAGGPRMLGIERAAQVLASIPTSVKRVGVFADQNAKEIAGTASKLGLDVVQLHSTPNAARIAELRSEFGGEVWPVCRVAGGKLPPTIDELVASGHGVLLDALVAGALGGTGVALPWADLSTDVAVLRARTRFVLAGGLRPENVGSAITALSPHVVDVSSGVERAPGIKDHDRMRAFRDAVVAVHASLNS